MPEECDISLPASSAVSSEKTPLLTESPPVSHKGSIQNTSKTTTVKIRTYWWRWVVLTLFSFNLAMTNIIWIPSAPIANTIQCYYDISLFWVNALSEVYMLVYIILLFPTVWLLDKYGLRLCMMIGAAFDAAGAALKLAGSGANYFWLMMLGQTLASVANVTVWTAAPLLSEVWFPSKERATATAIGGAIAPQLGILLGLGVTPFIVHTDPEVQLAVCGNDTVDPFASAWETENWTSFVYFRLLYFNSGVAALAVAVFIMTIFAFPNTPPSPPSISRQLESNHEQLTGCQQFKEFFFTTLGAFRNFYFVLYIIVCSIIVAVGGSVVSVINEVVHPYFEDHDEDIGYLGIAAQATSIVAMFVVGRILDWTKAFYIMNLVSCVLSTICVLGWAVLIQYQHNFYLLYIPAVLLGMSMQAFQSVAYEYAVEMTYPLPEGTSAGLINIGSQVLSIILISLVGYFVETANAIPAGLWMLVGVTAISAIISIFVRPELRRVKIDKKQK